tara:strand:+ start:804 stop:1064 length:261 start_codon:yes stop_codon:yes gene_type:complete
LLATCVTDIIGTNPRIKSAPNPLHDDEGCCAKDYVRPQLQLIRTKLKAPIIVIGKKEFELHNTKNAEPACCESRQRMPSLCLNHLN